MEVARALCVAAVAGAVHAHMVVGGDVRAEVVVRRLWQELKAQKGLHPQNFLPVFLVRRSSQSVRI